MLSKPLSYLVAALFGTVVVLAVAPAGAQPAPAQRAPAPPPLIPPKLLSAETVAYPEGAHGDALIVVELTIDTAGGVKKATIASGEEPFAGAVLANARAWKFVPARRGDVDVSARIRMRIEFHPPAPAPPPAAPGKAPPEGAAKRGVVHIEREEEVSVRGQLPEPGKITVGGGEVRQMPGAFGDPFRMMESLPGVTPILSGLPFFYVRGAPPGNTGYYLDGIRIPLLYHFALGPGVVHPALVDHVDFFSGAPPVTYGRFSGGILAGYTRPPATEFHGEWNARLVDSGALVEAPFAGGRGSVLVAGRYGYPGLIASVVSSEVTVAYWDYQARASYALTDRDTLTVFAFGSSDYLGSIKDDKEEQLFKTGFHRLDLRYDHRIRNTGRLRLALTLGADESGAGVTSDSKVGNGRLRTASLRTEIEDRLGPTVRVRAGADVVWDHSDLLDPNGNRLAPDESPYSFVYAPRNDVTLGAYADISWRPSRRVEIISGLRADVYTSRRIDQPVIRILDREHHLGTPATAAVAIEPRLSARVQLVPKLTYVATFGITHQPPSTLIPIAGLGFSERRDKLQTAFQASQGLELNLPLDFTATANVFLHEYHDLNDATASCGQIPFDEWDNPCLTRRVRGRAIGFEFLLRRPLTKRLTGWISYTLSRSTRESLLVGTRTSSQVEVPATVPAEFDRTHVVQVIGAYDLGHLWRAGLRFMLYSGRPHPRFDNQGTESTLATDARFPPYYRIDLRLEKAWKLGRTGRIALVFEGLNVTLNKEVISVKCRSANSRGVTCEEEKIGPVAIPSIGLEGSF